MQIKPNKTNMLGEISLRLLVSVVIPFVTGLLLVAPRPEPDAENPPDPSPSQDPPSVVGCEAVEPLSGSGDAAILCPAANVPEAGVVFVCGDSGLMAGIIDRASSEINKGITWSTLLNGLPIGETRYFVGRSSRPVASVRETTWLRTNERGDAATQLATDLITGDVHMDVRGFGPLSRIRRYIFPGTPERTKYLSYRLPRLSCAAGGVSLIRP